MRASLIVNPYASRVTEERVRLVEERLGAVETLLTERRGHATELAASSVGDAVFVLGGDGVVNEVVNGLPPGRPLGVIAGGHTNVFARAIGAPEDPAAALDRVQLPDRLRVDADPGGKSKSPPVDPPQRDPARGLRGRDGRRPGDLAYARVVARRLLSGYEQRLDLEGLGRAALVFVSNHAVFSYAGPVPLRFSPEARFELGLDVTAPERAGRATAMRLAGRLSVGRGIAGAPGVLTLHDADRVVVRCDEPLPLQADGEDLGDVTEAVFEAERNAIDVLV